ncbi:MAG: PDDEXK nuclease domain-containing protein [Nostocales cyanobacterium 94392]|nr:PDDEXK nuclease domain-containing protein [Nostocales cyanobacterium 94392]
MNYEELIHDISNINNTSLTTVIRAVNKILTIRNWFIGAYIVEYEQNGVDRAAYGTQLIKKLANDLKSRKIESLSDRNLKNFRQFALTYPALAKDENITAFLSLISIPFNALQIRQALPAEFQNVSGKLFPALQARELQNPSLSWQDSKYYQRLFSTLSWTHLVELTRIEDITKRAFYELECIKSNWSTRELKRQMNSMLYERVGLSKDKEAVLTLANEGQIIESPKNVLRDPYILEFLELEERATYSESDLEEALINHLQQFMHELGRDFCFVDRQFRITVAEEHYFLDLLFYHRSLQCLIAIDLKLGKFKHDYAGQMNFYLNYLKENVAYPHENAPVGILLCAEKDAEAVHYATAGLDNQLFVSRYMVALPSEEILKQWLIEEQVRLEKQFYL